MRDEITYQKPEMVLVRPGLGCGPRSNGYRNHRRDGGAMVFPNWRDLARAVLRRLVVSESGDRRLGWPMAVQADRKRVLIGLVVCRVAFAITAGVLLIGAAASLWAV